MKKEIADQWVAALRSGKYPQTSGSLKDECGFCCLGVLCDISNKGYWYENEHHLYFYMASDEGEKFSSETDLPYPVCEFAGMASVNGLYSGKVQGKWGHIISLVDMNDSAEASFEDIADFIEEHWEKL